MTSNYLFLRAKKKESFFYTESNDDYLSMLFDIFDEGYFFHVVKRELLNPLSRGINGNKTSVRIEKEIVTISPLYAADPEECAITIDRSKLLNLINQWEEVLKSKPNEILFKRISSCIKIEAIFYKENENHEN